MHITVIGRHPSLEYGFNGTMSLNWIRGFISQGCKVELLLPESSVHNPHRLCIEKGYKDFDQLPRWGANFNIRTISNAEDIDSNCDAVIWQTYRAEDNYILSKLRNKNFILTKNPPRVFCGNQDIDLLKSKNLMKNFDLIALSLMQDEEFAKGISVPDGRFPYVPRGFDTDLLNGRGRDDNICIGFDKPVKAGQNENKAIDHILKIADVLDVNFEIKYLSMRQAVERIGSEKIPHLRFDDYYNNFINKLWVYLPIDFKYSVHNKGYCRGPNGDTMILGLYENQIVETQIAGGLVVARSGDIPREIVMMPEDSFVESYEDLDSLLQVIKNHLDNFKTRSEQTRKLAMRKHNYINSAKIYLKSLKRLL